MQLRAPCYIVIESAFDVFEYMPRLQQHRHGAGYAIGRRSKTVIHPSQVCGPETNLSGDPEWNLRRPASDSDSEKRGISAYAS